MTKMISAWVVLAAFAGAAFAQTGTGSAAAGGPAVGSGMAAAAGESPPTPVAPASPAADARKICADAMNADPQFAAAIIKIADEKAASQRDADTLAAHLAANAHVQKNERTVIYGYAAMWIVAAAFVIFLWRRQQALKGEITNLRRDLEAAADESGGSKERA
jgi:hypothetical protein